MADGIEAKLIRPAQVAHDLNNLLGALVAYPDMLLMDFPDEGLRDPLARIRSQAKDCKDDTTIVMNLPFTYHTTGFLVELSGHLNRRLSTMEIYLDSVQRLTKGDEKVECYSGEMMDAIVHCRELVKHLTGNVGYEISKQDLNAIVRKVASQVLKGAQFEVEFDLKAQRMINGNELLLYELAENLMVNGRYAIENSPGDDGQLVLRTRDFSFERPICLGGMKIPAGEYVNFGVSDNGPGIHPLIISDVFSRLYTTKGGRGSGEGLDIVNNIREFHHAYLQLTTGHFMGASFDLLFPAYQRPQE
jgi:signal transduction histidine kinase